MSRYNISRSTQCYLYLFILAVFGHGIGESNSCQANSIKCDSGYEVKIILETTSDWADLTFTNLDFHYLGETVQTTNQVWLGILSVKKEPYDSTFTRTEFRIFPPVNLPPEIKFSVKKGRIGLTKIFFLTPDEETLAVFINKKNKPNDPTNQEDFSWNREMLQKAYGSKIEILPNTHQDELITQTERLVLAFYFPWYYPENWFWTGKLSIAHQPVSGLYSSADENILRSHIDMAKKAGIDGFICSWWGGNSVTDQNLQKLARICAESDFKFTIYLEEAKTVDDLRETIHYLDSTYSRQNTFLKFEGKPVIFIFNRILETIPLDSLRAVKSGFSMINYGYGVSSLEGFEGFHEFLPLKESTPIIKRFYRVAREVAHSKGKLFALPVIPGFDDRFVNTPGTFIDRKKGEYYKKTWEVALFSEPDWILVTTFNEWFEGTEIEPSKEYGDLYIRLTASYAKKLKGIYEDSKIQRFEDWKINQ